MSDERHRIHWQWHRHDGDWAWHTSGPWGTAETPEGARKAADRANPAAGWLRRLWGQLRGHSEGPGWWWCEVQAQESTIEHFGGGLPAEIVWTPTGERWERRHGEQWIDCTG